MIHCFFCLINQNFRFKNHPGERFPPISISTGVQFSLVVLNSARLSHAACYEGLMVTLLLCRAANTGGAIAVGVVAPERVIQLHISYAVIKDNRASNGGGISFRGGTVTIGPNVSIHNNSATYGGGGEGGGLRLDGARATIGPNVSISSNVAGTTGGGISWKAGGCSEIKGKEERLNCSRLEMLDYRSVAVESNMALLAGKLAFRV